MFLLWLWQIIILYLFCAAVNCIRLVLLRKRHAESLWPPNKNKPVKTLIVMGSGGHTGEMVRLLSTLDCCRFSPRLYLVARTDDTSANHVQHLESSKVSTADSFQIQTISRCREVHQSWITTIVSTLQSTLESARIVATFRPDLVICNGPGTCVPPCIVSFLMRVFWIKHSTIVFVESICRVKTLSFTGKIMTYLLADRALVQWPELHANHPKTVFLGRLV